MTVTIRTSMSELEGMARKALEAAGVASGLDRDGAFAAAWCEAHGLGGLAMLVRDLDALSGVPTHSGKRINAGGLSALVMGPLAIDLAMVMDLELRVENIRSPSAAIAYAVRRARNDRWFRLVWGDSEALAAEAQTMISLTNPDVATELTISCGKGVPPKISDVTITSVELERRRMRAFKEGLFLVRETRETLLEAAKRVLVPASESSRSGAGAEVDDNE